ASCLHPLRAEVHLPGYPAQRLPQMVLGEHGRRRLQEAHLLHPEDPRVPVRDAEESHAHRE
ncbi:unnamed protein product, partial [Effrenium voratum]